MDRDPGKVSADVDWREVARLVLTSREMDRLERWMVFLATVGSAAPFIGLAYALAFPFIGLYLFITGAMKKGHDAE